MRTRLAVALIARNWTWGCIAMRNADMDELFESGAVCANMPLLIVGSEWSRDSVRLGRF
jgi:hypothetical protein